MKNLLIFILCIFLTILTMAQTKEILIGSGVLINGYTGNVMYRKFKPDMQTALRFQMNTFNLNYGSREPFKSNLYNINAVSNNLKTDKSYSFGVGLFFGKQKNINTLEKFQFYKGFDIGFTSARYINNTTENINYSYSFDTTRVSSAHRKESKQTDLSINYTQFIGVQYQIVPNLYLSLEPSLGFEIKRIVFGNTSKRYNITDQTIEDTQNSETYNPRINYSLKVNPSARLWITYRLKGKNQ
ncbi:MAG: hypothetical protein IT243_03800 [Bacteroidia bacterium]|nr:hypothetical protein [Bacteroidia bacterium]